MALGCTLAEPETPDNENSFWLQLQLSIMHLSMQIFRLGVVHVAMVNGCISLKLGWSRHLQTVWQNQGQSKIEVKHTKIPICLYSLRLQPLQLHKASTALVSHQQWCLFLNKHHWILTAAMCLCPKTCSDETPALQVTEALADGGPTKMTRWASVLLQSFADSSLFCTSQHISELMGRPA